MEIFTITPWKQMSYTIFHELMPNNVLRFIIGIIRFNGSIQLKYKYSFTHQYCLNQLPTIKIIMRRYIHFQSAGRKSSTSRLLIQHIAR